MRTEYFSIHDSGIKFLDMGDMCFYIIFSLFDDPEIHDTSRQSASFDEDSFPIAHPRKSYSSISYFLYFYSREEFRHGIYEKLKP